MAEEEIPTIVGYRVFTYDGRWVSYALDELSLANAMYSETASRGLVAKFGAITEEANEDETDQG